MRPMLPSLLALAAFVGCLASGTDSPAEGKPALRRPVALVLSDDGSWVFVANQRAGTVSVVDAAARRLVAEVPLGRRLADLTATPDGRRLLAVDEAGDELLVLDRDGSSVKISHRVKVSPGPVSVRPTSDGARCVVASLWTRQLTVVGLGATPRVVRTIDLPFNPRRLLLIEGKAVVADSFGGHIAVVNLDRGEVDSVRTLPGHNIRALARSADGSRLLVAHQSLNPLGTASFDDIHWGNLITNNLRSLPLADLSDPQADLLRRNDLDQLGGAEHGTADPAAVAVRPEGQIVVALAGVHEVAVSGRPGWEYLPVGPGPRAVVTTPDGLRAYVANTYGDSVTVLDLKDRKVVAEVSLGPQPELTPADRGEMLFHDARLSHDGWLSCHSCHTDGHSPGLLADTLADGSYGTPKRILSLLGVGDTGPWAWNGSLPTLEAQVRRSIESTMQGKKPTQAQVSDLAAYLKTLSPPPPRARLLGKIDDQAVRRGRDIFTRQHCTVCHPPPLYTSAKTFDVGLADERGQRQFNPPSLRGVGQGGPYLHDGRAASLAEVFSRYRHQIKAELTKQELDELVQFLESL